MKTAPIVLFVYNRLIHTQQTVEALQKNILAEESDLIIYSDAEKHQKNRGSVNDVRAYIKTIDGFNSVSIIERDKNYGLANSIIDGVTTVVEKYGKVIVLEDDLVTSPYFLQFMNDGLNTYDENKDVASIHGYVYPVNGHLPEIFFLRGADCWGWATWKDMWALFETDGAKLLNELKQKRLIRRFDYNGTFSFSSMLKRQVQGKNNSWAVRWYASAFLKNKYTLYPGVSLVLNIGNDGSGTHCGDTNAFSSDLISSTVHVTNINVADDLQALAKLEEYFKKQKPKLLKQCMAFVFNTYRKITN